MNETLACTGCGRSLHVPDELSGQEVKCPACHHTFLAPHGEFGSAPPAALQMPEEPPPHRAQLYAEPDSYDRMPATDTRFQETSEWHGGIVKPPKVQAIAVMTMIGGIIALLIGVTGVISCVLLVWPGTYYSFVLGVMAIVRASALFGAGAREQLPPRSIAVMQIINIVNLDFFNLAFGIITLVFLGAPEVKAYFRR